jgi:hypothetical protein
VPAHPSVVALFVSMFLHGGLLHLAGTCCSSGSTATTSSAGWAAAVSADVSRHRRVRDARALGRARRARRCRSSARRVRSRACSAATSSGSRGTSCGFCG